MDKEAIGKGRTADVFADGDGYVCKLFKSFISAEIVQKEFNLASVAYQSGLPTPRPECMVTKNGRTGIRYERAAGRSLLSILSDDFSAAEKSAKNMALLHSKIHRVEFEHSEYSQKNDIAYALRNAKELNVNQKNSIAEYLLHLPDGCRLCHGDFHPDNIIVSDYLQIIDWMTASSGNPLCDVARSILIIENGEVPDSVPAELKPVIEDGQRQMAHIYATEYCALTHTSYDDITKWLLPLYAARLVENLSAHETECMLKKIENEMRIRL